MADIKGKDIKCSKCGYILKENGKCPRCGAIVQCGTQCSGNCIRCSLKSNK